jgi:hypothetical protein
MRERERDCAGLPRCVSEAAAAILEAVIPEEKRREEKRREEKRREEKRREEKRHWPAGETTLTLDFSK